MVAADYALDVHCSHIQGHGKLDLQGTEGHHCRVLVLLA